jgi:hypothetical protein
MHTLLNLQKYCDKNMQTTAISSVQHRRLMRCLLQCNGGCDLGGSVTVLVNEVLVSFLTTPFYSQIYKEKLQQLARGKSEST